MNQGLVRETETPEDSKASQLAIAENQSQPGGAEALGPCQRLYQKLRDILTAPDRLSLLPIDET